MKFLRNLLAVIVGLFIFSLFSLFVMIGVVSSLATMEEKVEVRPNSVLRLDLNRAIVERALDDPFAELGFVHGVKKPLGVLDITRAIKYAKTDDNIKGIYLDCGMISAGYASLLEIRKALLDFKDSGKFIVSYSEMFTDPGYYLASVADEVMVAQESIFFEFNGISSNTVFLKGLLDKLGIEPEIYRVGDYKGAVEPFMRKDLSPENEFQIKSFISSIYQSIIRDIAASRRISVDSLDEIASEMKVFSAEDALKFKLVDRMGYYDQVDANLKERLDLGEADKVEFSDIEKYIKAAQPASSTLNRIAVVIAAGEIVSGSGDHTMVGSEEFVKALQEVRDDENVKAVVLRINSPGGSGMASDVIWREIMLTKEKKPVIASMSDLAASGGYYIAMGCDTIVTNPTTITGSIGVFGLMFNIQKFLNDKLGITTDVVSTGKHSDIFNMTRPHTPEEKAMIQNMVEKFYKAFVDKAAEGRNMPVEKIMEIASGRVWTGEQAVQIGLADMTGDFDTALEIAAQKAGVDDYKIRYYPKRKTFLEQLFEGLTTEVELRIAKKSLGEEYYFLKKLNEVKNWTGIQARMPYDITIR